ncbi:hypothetical protein [Actinomadura hibisca]|uniref:hypothetical protein n=1 Tax=Actinomadura hibisca TaxID=68565 RepID=UPI00082A2ED1|nr:hypothetical protein [Actinomadura hibisca]
MPFVVVYDANVLYGNTLRDLLIRVAQSGAVQAKWTDRILDEALRNLTANRPDIAPTKLARLPDTRGRRGTTAWEDTALSSTWRQHPP